MKVAQPPEWAQQRHLWIGFPHLADEWPGCLEAAQAEITAFAVAVAQGGEPVRLICRNRENADRARATIGSDIDGIIIDTLPYGDIWLRDTGPLVVHDSTGSAVALRFGFNGWGGKYLMPGDQEIGALLAKEAGLPIRHSNWVLEGGAIDTDGTGLVVTTEQCLLNRNRNPTLSRDDIETRLKRDLGFDQILWLGDGLINDHTDGHVDNLARFVAPGRLALPAPSGVDDPNATIYDDAARRAEHFGLDVVRIPSPGRVERDGMIQPASHMNFVITNRRVIVPVYGTAHQDAALTALAECFPGREIFGLPANAILAGGGSFHCASQQMPQ
mgnify:CR=1 FL=1